MEKFRTTIMTGAKTTYIGEQPGDGTRYTFLIVISNWESFPDSVYEIAILPTKHDGTTINHAIYESRDNIAGINRWMDKSLKAVNEHEFENADKCKLQANSIKDMALMMGEDFFTLASAYRCANELISREVKTL